jgi:hypothetical protein
LIESLLIVLVVIAALGLIWLLFGAVRLFLSMRGWLRLFRSGAKSVKLVSVEPPRGFILRREAKVRLEVEGADGQSKQVEREIRIPIPQAFMWRVAGHVPTPIGRFTDKRTINRRIWGRRRKKPEQPA